MLYLSFLWFSLISGKIYHTVWIKKEESGGLDSQRGFWDLHTNIASLKSCSPIRNELKEKKGGLKVLEMHLLNSSFYN